MRFHDKVVLVIGASGGLGAAIAEAFAAEGALLILAARRPELLAPLAARLGATALAADLTDPASLAVLRDSAMIVHARLDGASVGSQLLEAVFTLAEERRLHAVRLEVVDTNVGARQLYERMGFEPVRTYRFPFIRGWLGYSAAIEMRKMLP